MVIGSLPPDMFRGLRDSVKHSAGETPVGPTGKMPVLRQNKMPDVDSYDSSSGIAVDVQQRLNCALP